MKKYFITGLLIWIPLAITVWVLNLIVTSMDRTLLLLPEALRPRAWLGVDVPGLGALVTLVVVLVTGLLAANIIGQRLVLLWESLLARTGGGTKPGLVYGATDEFGFNVTENPVHVRDLHATILHLLGFDHERFTYKSPGLDQKPQASCRPT